MNWWNKLCGYLVVKSWQLDFLLVRLTRFTAHPSNSVRLTTDNFQMRSFTDKLCGEGETC